MRAALRQAEKALALGEVPIGAVIVLEGKIIARGYNRRNTDHTTLAHAEITCIKKACKKVGDWRLEGCTLYCTLEPCQMCAGALIQSRIDRVEDPVDQVILVPEMIIEAFAIHAAFAAYIRYRYLIKAVFLHQPF